KGVASSSVLLVSYAPANTPSLMITSPVSDPTFHTGQATIDLGGIAPPDTAQVTWVNDQGYQGQAQGTANWTANGITLRIGSNRIVITASDAAGNQSNATITVVFSPFAILTSSLPGRRLRKRCSN